MVIMIMVIIKTIGTIRAMMLIIEHANKIESVVNPINDRRHIKI